MSTTIDQKVVEMRFDNKNFESNVQTSLSTLEKLKKSLNFDGASKGLDSINSAVKKVNFSPMEESAGKVAVAISHKWATLQHQIDRTVDKMVDSAGRMVKALTVDPVSTGFQEYETQINAVQTILANTQHNGTTLDEVNNALDTLNQYADKTIYNFTQMTKNIGTFTAAGVDLQTSVESIQGIANLAAVSGSTSQQASTAMYQLSQALAAGKVSLMDWNSVVNAGMGGKIFQDSLIRTSELLKTGAKDAIKTYGSFRESLTKGEWLTTEVLTETLKQLSGAYTEAELVAQGFTESQAKEITQLAETAGNAATKVKTWTQLWDTLKEAAQSGWTQTWELIIGDFEEAKEIWTKVSDVISGFINNMSEIRNNWLGGVLKSPWKKFNDELGEAGVSVDKVQDKLRKLYDDKHTKGSFDKLVDKHGSFEKALRSGAISADLLKEAVSGAAGAIADLSGVEAGLKFGDTGEDVKKVQQALTDLGYDFKKYGVDGIIGEETEGIIKAFQEANGLEITGVVDEETLAAIEKASSLTGKLKSNIDEVIDSLTGGELGGREKLFQGFANIWKGIVDAIRPVTMAFKKIFPPIAQESGMKLIDTFLSLTEKIQITDETAGKIYNTFKGLFAAIDIVATILGGGLSAAFKIVTKILGAFDLDILSVTAAVGKAISGFRDWLFETGFIARAIDWLVGLLPPAIEHIKGMFTAFKGLESVQNFVKTIKNIIKWIKQLFTLDPESDAFDTIVNAIKGRLKSLPGQMLQIGRDIIAGLKNGLGEGVLDVFAKISEIANTIITTICAILGIQSPSTVMFEIGRFIIEGLVNGIAAAIDLLINGVKSLGLKIADIFKKIDWTPFVDGFNTVVDTVKNFLKKIDVGTIVKTLLAIIPVGIDVVLFKRIFDFIKALTTGVSGVSDIINNVADVVDTFGDVLSGFGKSLNKKLKSEALLNMAIAIGILAAAVIALTFVDPEKLYNAVAVVVVLAGVLWLLSIAMDKMSSASIAIDGKSKSLNMNGLKTGLISIGLVMLLLAATVKLIGSMDPEEVVQGFLGLGAMIIALGAFMVICGAVGKKGETKDMDKIGKMLTKMAIAMLLMVAVVKLASKLSASEMLEGAAFAAGFALFVRAIAGVAKGAGKHVSKVGGLMIKLTIAMGLMVGVVKLINMLSPSEMIKGAVFATGFAIFVAALVKVTKIGKKQQIAKLGGLLLSISIAMAMMVLIIEFIDMLSISEMAKGVAFVAGFVIFVKALVQVTKIGSEEKMAKVSGTLLAVSIAIGILAAIAIVIGLIPVEQLAKGVTAVAILGLVMAAMIKATQGASKAVGNIVVMTLAIALMAGACAALTLIDGAKLVTAAGSLALVMGAFALISKCVSSIDKGIVVGLITMTAVVGGLALILGLMAKFDVQASISTAIALGVLLSAMAVALNILSKCGTVSGESLLAMVLIGLIVAELGIVFNILNTLNVQPSIETATALSILLLGMSAACLILSAVGPVAIQAILGAAALAGVILILGGLIAAIGGLVTDIPQIQTFLDNGIPALEAIGIGLGKFVGGIVGGALGGLADGVLDSLPNVSSKLTEFINNFSGVDPGAIDSAKSLVNAMGEIGLATVGTTLSDIFTFGGTSMEKFQTDGVAFFEAMKAISTASQGIVMDETAIEAVIDIATQLSGLQQSLDPIGGVITWFTGRDDLGTFGDNIGSFILSMKTALGWLDGVTINTDALGPIIDASMQLSGLQQSLEPIGGVITWFAGRDDLGTFGVNVGSFILSMKTALGWLDGVTINTDALGSIISAATDLSGLQESLEPIGGVITWFTGRDDLGTFGENIGEFMSSMNTALSTLEGTTLDEAALTSVISAATQLATLQESLEPIGGVISWFTGKDDLGTFGEKIGEFATAIAALKEGMGENGISQDVITSITNTGSALVELNNILPTEGWFDGKMSLSDFSTYIQDFATALSDFNTKVSGMNSDGIDTAISTAYRLKTLIDTIATLDTTGISKFTGIGSGGVGADGAVSDIAEAMADFSSKVSDIDTGAVSTSVSAALRLKTLINGLVDLDTSGIDKFDLTSIGDAMKSYIDSVAGMDVGVVSSSISSANRLKNFISSLAGLDTSGVSSFKSAISSLGEISLDDITSAFSGATGELTNIGSDLIKALSNGIQNGTSSVTNATTNIITVAIKNFINKQTQFQTMGVALMTKLITGITSKAGQVSTAMSSALNMAVISVRLKWFSMYSAGTYLGSGLVQGINAKKTDAYNAGYALGQAAVQGEKDGQASNSPSKLTIQAGKWLGEGLVIGMERMAGSVYKSGHALGETAANSMSSTVSKLAAAINTDIDSQPTIRPVLDLSAVEAGAGAISGMFGAPMIGVNSNIDAISTMMSRRNQNGTNADVIAAIDKLGKDISANAGTTSYNINGVTYDDGSNIKNAVETIVRAAVMERRM